MHTLNLGILAHVDAGKTSLTERLLFDNGTISRLGSVDAGSTQTDSGDIERQRGITIRSAVASFTTGSLQVNLVDTPGHPDFIAEVERAMAVLDGAVLVLSAVEGVQAQTRVLMKSLRKLGLPTLIFVNKIDRAGARDHELVRDISRKLSARVLAINSVRDLGTPAARTVPCSLSEREARIRAAEILADNDDATLARLVDGSVPSAGELSELLVGQACAGLVHPVFFGSALSGQGAGELTDGMKMLQRACRRPAGDSGLSGTVFAIERGGSGEKIAYLRLFSGELRERQRVTFRRREPGGRISELSGQVTGLEVIGGSVSGSREPGQPGLNQPGPRQPGPRLPQPPAAGRCLTAGNIARLRGLPKIRVGDVLGSGSGLHGGALFAPPSLETIVRPQAAAQASALHTALMSLADQDPLIRTRSAGGGATSVLLYGAVQKEVIAATLQRNFGVEALFEQSQAVYFERPAGVGEAIEQISPHGPNEFLATIGLRVEPALTGSGLSFTRQVELGSLPRAFHRAIEDTVLRSLEQGLHGWQVIDCAVTLTRSGFSPPGSVAADFRNLTPLVLMRALHIAGSQVFEPCDSFELEIPGDVLSAVLGHLALLGAGITRSAEAGESWLVAGEIPARLVQDFTAALPGLSHGEGAWWCQPGGDRRVRGLVPVRERSDGNPLDRGEYLRFLASGRVVS
jgi:ribosomal protection tetracycline resistance protein